MPSPYLTETSSFNRSNQQEIQAITPPPPLPLTTRPRSMVEQPAARYDNKKSLIQSRRPTQLVTPFSSLSSRPRPLPNLDKQPKDERQLAENWAWRCPPPWMSSPARRSGDQNPREGCLCQANSLDSSDFDIGECKLALDARPGQDAMSDAGRSDTMSDDDHLRPLPNSPKRVQRHRPSLLWLVMVNHFPTMFVVKPNDAETFKLIVPVVTIRSNRPDRVVEP